MERGACCGAYVSRVSAWKKMQRQGFGSERLQWDMGAQLEETVWGETGKRKKKNISEVKRVKRIRYQSAGSEKGDTLPVLWCPSSTASPLGVECVRIRECEQ